MQKQWAQTREDRFQKWTDSQPEASNQEMTTRKRRCIEHAAREPILHLGGGLETPPQSPRGSPHVPAGTFVHLVKGPTGLDSMSDNPKPEATLMTPTSIGDQRGDSEASVSWPGCVASIEEQMENMERHIKVNERKVNWRIEGLEAIIVRLHVGGFAPERGDLIGDKIQQLKMTIKQVKGQEVQFRREVEEYKKQMVEKCN